MPLNLTQEDLDFLAERGIDPNDIQEAQPQEMSKGRAALATLKGHAGGIAGGGAGALSGAALGEAVFPPGGGIPGALIGGIVGSLGGGYTGQKLQNAVLPSDLSDSLQQESQQAQEQHPVVSMGTDVIASALASGGSFSPKTLLSAGRGLLGRTALNEADEVALQQLGREAVSPSGNTAITSRAKDVQNLQGVLAQSAINPAIDIGSSLATGQGLPSGRQLLGDVAGGALFGKQAGWAGKLTGHDEHSEPSGEPRFDATGLEDIGESTDPYPQRQLPAPPQPRGLLGRGSIQLPERMPSAETSVTSTPTPEGFTATPDILQEVIDKGATKPVSVQRIFPNLNLSETEAQSILEQAQKMKSSKPPTMESVNPNITPEEQKDLEGMSFAPKDDKSHYQVTVQNDNGIPGTGYVQVDEIKNGENVRSVSPEVLQKEGVQIPSKDELLKLPQGKYPLDTLNGNQKNTLGESSRVRNPIPLIQHIMSGSATTGSVLQHLVDYPNHPFSEMAKHLLSISDSESLKVPWSVGAERSNYNVNTDRVSLQHSDAANSRVVMEEALHSLTSKKLPRLQGQGAEYYNRLQTYLKTGDNDAVKSLIQQYLHVADKLGYHPDLFMDESNEAGGIRKASAGNPDQMQSSFDKTHGNVPYAMGDLHEFVSHVFHNEQFQNLLNEMPSNEPNKTVWQKIVDSVRKLLGFDVKQNSMLDSILRTGSDVVSQERPEVTSRNQLNKIHELANQKYKQQQDLLHKLNNEHPNWYNDIQSKAASPELVKMHKEMLRLGEEGKQLRDKATAGIIDTKNAPDSEQKFTPKSTPTDEKDNHMGIIGKGFRAALDTIRDINHPLARPLGDAFQRYFQEKENILGSQWNPIAEKLKGLSQGNKSTLEKAMRYELENKKDAPLTMFTNAKQLSAFREAKSSLQKNFQYRLKEEEPVMRGNQPSMPQSDPHYWPTTSNPKTANILRANTDAEAISNLKKSWVNERTQRYGQSPEQALSDFRDYQRAIQGTTDLNTANNTFFNAARRAQGIPLPSEFTRPGFDRNLEAYFQAQSSDNAYYKHIEKNPEAMAALGETKDAWGKDIPQHEDGPLIGNTAVKNVLKEIKGESVIGLQGQVQKKAESLATATILGPQTELHKMVSNFFKLPALADNPVQGARVVAHAITNIAEGWTHAKENGKIVMTAKSAGDMFNSQLTAADKLAGVARGLRQIYTLNDITDKLNIGMMQAGSEMLVKFKLDSANSGNTDAMRTMRNLDPDWVRGKTYDEKGITQLASNMVGNIHGTRDARTLPSLMLHDNEISAFMKLASWGVAQTNSFMRDVWTPATHGNLGPLLNATLGAAVGGMTLKVLREKMAGKKSQIPSLSEIAASSRGMEGNIPLVAYNAMAAASYAGFGGMLSTIARYPFDWSYRNVPQGATFPLDTLLTDTATTVSHAAEAIANDPNLNWFTLGSEVGRHVMSQDFQLGRIAMNQAINAGAITGTPAEKKFLQDKLSEKRHFEMTEGMPLQGIGGTEDADAYMNLEQKKFKREENPQQAAQMLPELVQNIVQKYSGSPDIMKQKLDALKSSQYNTMPNPSDLPLSFMKYVRFLTTLEGPEAAQQAVQDYMKHRAVNQVKSSIVP